MKVALLFLTALVPATYVAGGVPLAPTPVAQLSTPDLQHHELLRIDRDFGKEEWEIVLDGWMQREREGSIAEVRFWWVKTDAADRRKPFSEKLRKYVKFGFDRQADGALAVRLAGDRKEFQFRVELDGERKPRVFADVGKEDGSVVRHCQTPGGRLIARRFLGIPVGVKEMRVTCLADDGTEHRGHVIHRTLPRGEPYVE